MITALDTVGMPCTITPDRAAFSAYIWCIVGGVSESVRVRVSGVSESLSGVSVSESESERVSGLSESVRGWC